jgi:hypothetical protein
MIPAPTPERKMMKIYVQEQGLNSYMATMHDERGEIGFPSFATTRDDAAFRLGVAFGRFPEKFARQLGELLREGE